MITTAELTKLAQDAGYCDDETNEVSPVDVDCFVGDMGWEVMEAGKGLGMEFPYLTLTKPHQEAKEWFLSELDVAAAAERWLESQRLNA